MPIVGQRKVWVCLTTRLLDCLPFCCSVLALHKLIDNKEQRMWSVSNEALGLLLWTGGVEVGTPAA